KLNTINYESKKSRLVFIRDITKRKIAEKRSERDKNMLEQAQKIASLGSWEWDIQKSTLFCSKEIYQILEVEDDQLTKKSPRWLVQFIPNIEKNKIFKGFIESIKTAERLDIEFPIISSTGSRKIAHSQSQVYKDLAGKPERVIGTWLDISERIRFEQILKEAKLKAEESDKLKSAFLANMSHEIRTPMNAILGFANLLKRNQLKTEVKKEYIDHILQSGEGLLKLINDIVDISKIESNQLNIENGPVHLNEMLDQLYNRYEELLLLKNRVDIKLIIEKALPDPNFMVFADAFRLQQVLSNLINNSIKFTYDGTIQFGYKIANSELKFFVEDEGVGVPFEKKDIIFKRFGKLDDPEKMNKSGTGLGLSISKSLVNLMGGKIWLDSGLAGCTRFCFTIPLKISNLDESKIQKNKYPIKNDELNLKNKTILITEDEVLNYKLLETLLQKTGANVMWAKNGIEAVEIVNANQVDLIFMDIKMPQMNGYEATKAIKNIDKNIPIIAQTAFAFSNERKYILQSGCDMYLTKPINHNEIFEVLNKYLT
ncbi:MAG: response regulator, partial [Bacteroidales bacterium]|nr:response regulator [Bacteroidales bacterium]